MPQINLESDVKKYIKRDFSAIILDDEYKYTFDGYLACFNFAEVNSNILWTQVKRLHVGIEVCYALVTYVLK